MATKISNPGAGRRRAGASPGRWRLWAGRVMSAIPVLMMLMSAGMKLSHSPQMVATWVGTFGYPETALLGIGLLELACVGLYVIPQTAVLGAVLLTGYLGGAVATHVRIGDVSAVTPLLFGVLVWGGLFLRDERIRALLPLRQTREEAA